MEIDLVHTELANNEKISIISLVNGLIEEAFRKKTSDIHIDPTPSSLRVRFRIDGVLHDVYTLPTSISSEVISRIKVLASLRTDEHNSIHDGRFHLSLSQDHSIDVRVSIAPTYHGENVVMRLLSEGAEHFSLENLGFSVDDQMKILDAIHKPSGMILITGPTGSGKTTTLYTLIQLLNSKEVSLITIEDPIEYAISGVEQIQVNQRTNLTFATGLKTILRQDPNIIMVGEIRDSETASIAVNTALTGHLLLSTLHTNDAATTLPRLLDMKVESFLVASTINIAIGQRLVRKICVHCKKQTSISKDFLSASHFDISSIATQTNTIVYEGKGCDACGGTGYMGRVSINEVLVVTEDIRDAIARKASSLEIKQIAIKNGMTTMRDDGLKKVLNGQTTIREVLRVIHE